MTEPASLVFVVDDDISVRESLELLTRYEGWQTETFSSAREFLARPRACDDIIQSKYAGERIGAVLMRGRHP